MKKNFTTTLIILITVVIGIFLFGNGKKTFLIKNNAPYLANIQPNSDFKPITENIGNLNIPQIKIPQNLTEDLAKSLAQGIIDLNSEPELGRPLPGPGINLPDVNEIAGNFIKSGLVKANQNILNIDPPKLILSPDNSREAIEKYLAKIQGIINSNLKSDQSLLDLLEEINKNNGQGAEKLLPIIAGHEAAANQLETASVPSDLKNLITEEIRLLRMTANILRPFTNIENDPMATIAAIGQFQAILTNWQDLQKKFDLFIQKLNNL